MRRSVTTTPAVGALVLALVGCSAAPNASPLSEHVTPRVAPASPSPSPSPSPARPSTEPTHIAGVEPGLYAKVVADNLRIRSKPTVSDDSEKLEPLLEDGIRLLVIEGPVEASGYDWFHVQPSGYAKPGQNYPAGWVAAGKDGEHWIEPYAFDCPPVPTDVDGFGDLNPAQAKLDYYYRISCYGGLDVTFTARLEQQAAPCVGSDLPYAIEPDWFGDCSTGYHHGLVALNSYHRGVGHAWAPNVDLSIAAGPGAPPEEWPTVEVTGQFDHPAAKTCQRVPNVEDTPDFRLPALTILDCRNVFVVTSVRELSN